MLISPTEPKPLKELGTTSSSPERYGSDFLLPSASFGMVGVQRKELKDLVVSASDGRLAREVAQMKALGQGILLIEGRPRWSDEGIALWTASWTEAQHHGLIWAVQLRGLWVSQVDSISATQRFLSMLSRWLSKERHSSLSHRPTAKGTSPWGTVNNRDYGIHLLQGLDGVGPELAARIYDKFGVPWKWVVGVEDLQSIPGIGPQKAGKILSGFSDGIADGVS